jgi:hypothetical protein
MQLQNSMVAAFVCIFAFVVSAFGAESPKPLLQAHSHNDYEHTRPLLDALSYGFCSVEADVHLVNGELLVAHDADQIKVERTLEKLYLAPLRELAEKNGGRIYPNGPTLTLLVDIKTEAEAAYQELKKVLSRYEKILTRFSGDKISTNAVTIILSGNRPRATLQAETNRLAAFDGRLADLPLKLPVSFMHLVSDNWKMNFQWNGEGEFSPTERKKLYDIVGGIHGLGRKVRFWGAPDTPKAWAEFHTVGVDLINTDNLEGLAKFLQSKE